MSWAQVPEKFSGKKLYLKNQVCIADTMVMYIWRNY